MRGVTSQSAQPLVELRGLTVHCPAGTLLHELDLTIHPGERVALLGASGAGKSLACAAILGILAPGLRASGRIVLGGRDVDLAEGPDKRLGLGAVFQDSRTALNPLYSVGSQIVSAVRRAGSSRREASAAAAELLRRLAFEDPERVLASQPGELSGGQRQRACLALALAAQPLLLVADEPTTALDTISQAEVVSALAAATGPQSGTGLLLVTHDLPAASQLCHRALVLADGRVVEDTTMHELLIRPSHPASRALVGAALDEARLQQGHTPEGALP